MSDKEIQTRAPGDEAHKDEISILAMLQEAIEQIRTDHAFIAERAGYPCACKWCHV
jgi:hypothetical protein